MIKRTIREYDLHHNGSEIDRLELIEALGAMASLINQADLAHVTVDSVKSNVIAVTIEEVDAP